ncbi:MAG: OmpA family protein [Bacteroidaceae bacterium]|nr:OmpA family protein [Bacteroidaceae bacterium]
MKTKLILLSLAMVGFAMSASAQTKEKYTSNGADNIFISATGGISTTYSGKSEGKFGKIAPHFTVSVGKWFTPVIGLRGQVGFWRTNFYTQHNPSNAARQENHKNMVVARLDGLYNISNAIWGYNPDRLFTLSVFAGPGLTFAKTSKGFDIYQSFGDGMVVHRRGTNGEKLRPHINGSVGLLGKFNVNQYWDIDLEVRGEVADSYLGYTNTSTAIGALYFGAGVTYTFGGKKFQKVNPYVDVTPLNDEINRLRNELAAALNKPAEVRTVVETKTVTETKFNKTPIFFKIGSSKLDNYAKATVKLVADGIKASGGTFKVQAYADKATGSSSFNQKLTDARAKAVYDALVAEGVPTSQLEIVSNGGVDNMFGDRETTRVVIMGVD